MFKSVSFCICLRFVPDDYFRLVVKNVFSSTRSSGMIVGKKIINADKLLFLNRIASS